MLLHWNVSLLLPDLLVGVFVFFCSAIYVFLWFARIFLLFLALRLMHTTLGSVSISATSWTGTVNLPDLILHLIFCAFPLRQSRLVIGSRERVLTWTCHRVTFLEKALLAHPLLYLAGTSVAYVKLMRSAEKQDVICCKKGFSQLI